MLLKRELLEEIKAGKVDLVFRRWSRPTVKAGGTLKTKVGLLQIGAITDMDPGAVGDADAKRAGFADVVSDAKEYPGGKGIASAAVTAVKPG